VILNSKLGFSFHSDIVNLVNRKSVTKREFKIGELLPMQSIVIPLFVFDKKRNGDNLYSTIGNVYIPKSIQYKDFEEKLQIKSIREMLKYPFSISVSIDERG